MLIGSACRCRRSTATTRRCSGFYGAVHDLPVTSGFTFDVGGGSAEISAFRDRRLVRSWSMPLGSLRMSDAFLVSDPPDGPGDAEPCASR